ncbi:MAG: MotA/TolQ/ExbB proton channel family protein [Planctomycetota bacterium]
MRGRLNLAAAIFLVALVLAAYGATMAAEPTTPAASAEKKAERQTVEGKTLWDTIKAGGWIGGFIIFLAGIAIALSVEHLITIRRGVIMPAELLADVEECFEKEEYEQAIAVCEEQPTFFTNVIAAGLSRINAGYKQMEEAMSEAGEEAATGLQQKVSYLALIANIAPMLGLLGTVAGMISAFSRYEEAGGSPDPSKLASSIQLALVTTLLGLIVAIPVMCAYHFFKNKVEKIVLEVGAISGELMARFRPVE